MWRHLRYIILECPSFLNSDHFLQCYSFFTLRFPLAPIIWFKTPMVHFCSLAIPNKKGEVVSLLGTPFPPDVAHCSFFLTAVSFLSVSSSSAPLFIHSTSCSSPSLILPAVTSLFVCPLQSRLLSTVLLWAWCQIIEVKKFDKDKTETAALLKQFLNPLFPSFG